MQKKELSGGKPAVMREILDECLGDLARPRGRCESSMNFQPAGKGLLVLGRLLVRLRAMKTLTKLKAAAR